MPETEAVMSEDLNFLILTGGRLRGETPRAYFHSSLFRLEFIVGQVAGRVKGKEAEYPVQFEIRAVSANRCTEGCVTEPEAVATGSYIQPGIDISHPKTL